MIDVQILDGSLDPHALDVSVLTAAGSGPRVVFEGIVRAVEDGRTLLAAGLFRRTSRWLRINSVISRRRSANAWIGRACCAAQPRRVKVGEVSFLLVVLAAP